MTPKQSAMLETLWATRKVDLARDIHVFKTINQGHKNGATNLDTRAVRALELELRAMNEIEKMR